MSCLIATKAKVSGNIDTVVVIKIRAAAAKIKLCQQILVDICLYNQQLNTAVSQQLLSITLYCY